MSAANPTAEETFGPDPWVTNPGGHGPFGVTYGYNPMFFAMPATAAKMAQKLGGKVAAKNAITGDGSPFIQNQPNLMVEFPNGGQVNAGLMAMFWNYGWNQSFIDYCLTLEVQCVVPDYRMPAVKGV